MPPALAAMAILLAVTFGYIGLCAVSPFGRCRKCQGKGRIPHRIGRGVRYCRRCGGAGIRLRIGRRITNHAARIHHDGTR